MANKICLCCGKKINNNEAAPAGWHIKCVQKFFGTSNVPDIQIDEEVLSEYVTEMLKEGNTVGGVQKKLSMHLEKGDNPRLTLVGYPAGYILKPQTKEYENLTELEFCTMHMARSTGIQVADHGLIGDSYITKRMDRGKSGEKYAMEDFCQLSDKLTQDKYKGSYEGCAKIINKYSDIPGLDMAEFFLRIIFCYATGNSDMHLKNFSLIEREPGARVYELSKAYDLLPVQIVLPEDMEESALTVNGKKRKIKKDDFYAFAMNCGVSEKTCNVMVGRIFDMKNEYKSIISKMPFSGILKEAYCRLIDERVKILAEM